MLNEAKVRHTCRIFTVRLHVMQRTVLLSQFYPSVCLSICLTDACKWYTADILISHERAVTLVFWHQQWLVGNAPFPVKYLAKVTHPFEKRRLRDKRVLCRAGLTYNNCRQLHNEFVGRRHSTPQSHRLSTIAELLVVVVIAAWLTLAAYIFSIA